jgi:hypothetical protein
LRFPGFLRFAGLCDFAENGLTAGTANLRG